MKFYLDERPPCPGDEIAFIQIIDDPACARQTWYVHARDAKPEHIMEAFAEDTYEVAMIDEFWHHVVLTMPDGKKYEGVIYAETTVNVGATSCQPI
mgnify:CR=1 FL=1